MTRRSSIHTTEFEIHFAAEVGGFTAALREGVNELGFRDDPMVDHGVTFSPNDPIGKVSCPLTGMHITWDSFSRADFVRHRVAFDELLSAEKDRTTGYAHCEVIRPEWDLDLDPTPFRPEVRWPADPFESSFSSKSKRWDIHISADRSQLDPRLEAVLFEHARMYFIDLQKKTGRIHRVFTIQGTNSAKKGLQLFNRIADYLYAAGGMAGSIKFEETCYWRELGNPKIVPPTIDDFALARP